MKIYLLTQYHLYNLKIVEGKQNNGSHDLIKICLLTTNIYKILTSLVSNILTHKIYYKYFFPDKLKVFQYF